jgi:hypothetical protein
MLLIPVQRSKKQKKIHAVNVEDDHTFALPLDESASDRMVHLLKKPQVERQDSEVDVFCGDTIDIKTQSSLDTKTQSSSSTPSTSEIPIAFVIF